MPYGSMWDLERQEEEAYERGKHERRKGFDKDMNPYVRTDLTHEPDLYENWIAGWNVMDSRIRHGYTEEYD